MEAEKRQRELAETERRQQQERAATEQTRQREQEAERQLTVARQITQSIPEIARGYEEIYRRFLNGKLIYKPDPNSTTGQLEFPFSSLSNPLEGTFDLSRCGDTGTYLSIATGYRKTKLAANKDKVEIWITPKFVMEKALNTSAKHYGPIMTADKWTSPVGILWTYGNWSETDGDCGYLTNKQFDEISTKNLYENWCESAARGQHLGLRIPMVTFKTTSGSIYVRF